MKKIIASLLLVAAAAAISAQPRPFKVAKNANHFVYASYDYGEHIDTQYTQIEIHGGPYYLVIHGNRLPGEYRPAATAQGTFIKGYSVEDIFVNDYTDTVTYLTTIFDGDKREHYRTISPFSRKDIQFDTDYVNGLTRYTCSINSNKLEFYVQPFTTIWHGGPKRGKESRDLSPVPYYGRFPGLLVSFWRNGQCLLQLVKTDQVHSSKFYLSDRYPLVTARELSNIKRERMVVTTRVFDSVQLCWGMENSHVDGGMLDMPYDSVLHFAGGTLALKRVKLPILPSHYQTFVELHQVSNGDAYDRTGSLFVIPKQELRDVISFFDGMNHHPDSLPVFVGRDGERYQGIAPVRDYPLYQPPLELVRFFTSFGIGHFNDRVRLDGLEWNDENYYKQEVTELSSLLQGDVWIGVWIGNYDRGGHRVTVDIKSYPGDNKIDEERPGGGAIPLFNTCNVLEMAGQNYGKLFATDSLTVTVTIPNHAQNARLRYIATGHGGWEGGDEFNPKTHSILVDGEPAFTYTPWRGDCGRYREWNPVSGNFWNGLSSSDYSRSGWCPGTATQPVYFNLSHLAPGAHTLTVAIPQGKPQAGSFSHWCVSGVLLYD